MIKSSTWWIVHQLTSWGYVLQPGMVRFLCIPCACAWLTPCVVNGIRYVILLRTCEGVVSGTSSPWMKELWATGCLYS